MNNVSFHNSSRIRPLKLDTNALSVGWARRREMRLNLCIPTPGQHRIGGEFLTVIADNHTSLAALGNQRG
tara:strand:+ start:31881 stop:32090 length:210 start_codon:yes stop_codon:yes gene_type:complete